MRKFFTFIPVFFLFLSCTQILESNDELNCNPSGTVQLKGLISDSNGNERTAMPSEFADRESYSYEVKAKSGEEEIEAEMSGMTFTITLSEGEWKFTAIVYSDSTKTKKILSGTKIIKIKNGKVTDTSGTVIENLKIEIDATENSDFDTEFGKVELSIEAPNQVAKITSIWNGGTETELSTTTVGSTKKAIFSKSNVATSKNTLRVNFYSTSGTLLYTISEIVLTVSGFTTDKFVDCGAMYISQGKIVITDFLIKRFISTTFCVSSSNGDDSNSGGFFAPFKTIQKAVDVIEEINDGITEYQILLLSNLEATNSTIKSGSFVYIDPTSQLKLKITSYGSSFYSINANLFGKVIFIGEKAEVTLKNITIAYGDSSENGGGIYNKGTLNIKSGTKIEDNRTVAKGGGIFNDGTVKMEGGKVGNNYSGIAGHGIYNNGTLYLSGSAIISEIDNIYLPEGKYITLNEEFDFSENPSETIAIILPETCREGLKVLNGTKVADYYEKILVTAELSYWKIDEEGKLQKITGSTTSHPTDTSSLTSLSSLQSAPTSGSYKISTSAEMETLISWINSGKSLLDITFTLANDIEVTETIGTSTNAFKGHFDGNNYEIALNIDTNSAYKGLFSFIEGSTISNVITKGTVKCSSYAGGIAGKAINSNFINCTNHANVETSSSSQAGGLVGTGYGTFKNCKNYGNVTSNSSYAGGIIGCGLSGASQYQNCANYGTITGGSYIGGIDGDAYNNLTTAKNCVNIGTINCSSSYKGAIFGSGSGIAEYCYYFSNCGVEKAIANKIDTNYTNVGSFTMTNSQTIINALNSNRTTLDFAASGWKFNADNMPTF